MIVSTSDLIDYMSGINLNAPQETAAEFVLAGIQADLERYLNRPLEPRTITETVRVDTDGRLHTTVSPIISVDSTSGLMIQAGSLYVGSSVGSTFTLGTFGMEEYRTVTYVAGIDARTDPQYADVRLSIMRVASREMTNRHDDTLSVKGLETDNVGEPTGPQNGVQGWTYDELRMHDRLRKRVIV